MIRTETLTAYRTHHRAEIILEEIPAELDLSPLGPYNRPSHIWISRLEKDKPVVTIAKSPIPQNGVTDIPKRATEVTGSNYRITYKGGDLGRGAFLITPDETETILDYQI
jgi:hypothetical protein